jgi:hypothetical protein
MLGVVNLLAVLVGENVMAKTGGIYWTVNLVTHITTVVVPVTFVNGGYAQCIFALEPIAGTVTSQLVTAVDAVNIPVTDLSLRETFAAVCTFKLSAATGPVHAVALIRAVLAMFTVITDPRWINALVGGLALKFPSRTLKALTVRFVRVIRAVFVAVAFIHKTDTLDTVFTLELVGSGTVCWAVLFIFTRWTVMVGVTDFVNWYAVVKRTSEFRGQTFGTNHRLPLLFQSLLQNLVSFPIDLCSFPAFAGCDQSHHHDNSHNNQNVLQHDGANLS